MERADAYRMIKIKQGQVKSKVGNLRHDFDQAYVRSKIKQRVEDMNGAADPQYFSIDHPRTK